MSLELGGNAPFLVFEDADIAAAVEGAVASKYRNTGQTCVCTNRFIVHEAVYDAFTRQLAAAVSALKVGDGMEAGTQQGPLINESAVQTVEAHIADATAKGRKDSHRWSPTRAWRHILRAHRADGVTEQMRCAVEETFGPVAPVFRFSDEAEALRIANATDFGLASYLYTRDLSRAWRVAEKLEAGIVGVNTGLISTEVAPFGGVKMSGQGREGSKYGLLDYTELKYVCMAVG